MPGRDRQRERFTSFDMEIGLNYIVCDRKREAYCDDLCDWIFCLVFGKPTRYSQKVSPTVINRNIIVSLFAFHKGMEGFCGRETIQGRRTL